MEIVNIACCLHLVVVSGSTGAEPPSQVLGQATGLGMVETEQQ